MTLIGDVDLTYHWNREVIFCDVTHLACPFQFCDPIFREPTPRELASVREDEPAVVVAFDVEDMPCLIAAESVAIRHGTVMRR
ncbi:MULTISPECIES: hypothetical protein [unclassified Actinoplanes]|uniref:hypothetical protein n=1 Tax=unclassified Actinoplanes TaxID=2626549 RepID=UPI0012BA94FF|nr:MULTISPECIES: hypothetical protein [unclassified Actinoplanes]